MNEREIKGITTELLCENEFVKRGFDVSVPISSYCKYDFIVDICGKLYRFQAKHSNKTKSGIEFYTKSTHLSSNGSIIKRYTQDDIDYFCTFCDNICYVIPIYALENRTSVTLSTVGYWKNGKSVMLAEDYYIDKQIENIKNENFTNNQKSYVIQQFSKDGRLVHEYSNIIEFDICKNDYKKRSHISECISGKRKSAYGFVWKKIKK
jgi:hypothetical protein